MSLNIANRHHHRHLVEMDIRHLIHVLII